MENSLPGKGGQHLVCIRLGELRSPEAEWEILLSAGGVGLLGCGSSGADRKEEAKRGRREEETLALPPLPPLWQTLLECYFLRCSHRLARELLPF